MLPICISIISMASPCIKIDGNKVIVNGAPICRVNTKHLKTYKYLRRTEILLEYDNGKRYILDYLTTKTKKISGDM